MFAVIRCLGLGASPIVCGVSLDAIGTYELVTGWFSWTRRSIYFVAILVINLVAFWLINQLAEHRGTATEQEHSCPRDG